MERAMNITWMKLQILGILTAIVMLVMPTLQAAEAQSLRGSCKCDVVCTFPDGTKDTSLSNT